jgi:hypothetical protein
LLNISISIKYMLNFLSCHKNFSNINQSRQKKFHRRRCNLIHTYFPIFFYLNEQWTTKSNERLKLRGSKFDRRSSSLLILCYLYEMINVLVGFISTQLFFIIFFLFIKSSIFNSLCSSTELTHFL